MSVMVCPECSGRKTQDCYCAAEKKKPSPHAQCRRCKGTLKIPCQLCAGKGTLPARLKVKFVNEATGKTAVYAFDLANPPAPTLVQSPPHQTAHEEHFVEKGWFIPLEAIFAPIFARIGVGADTHFVYTTTSRGDFMPIRWEAAFRNIFVRRNTGFWYGKGDPTAEELNRLAVDCLVGGFFEYTRWVGGAYKTARKALVVYKFVVRNTTEELLAELDAKLLPFGFSYFFTMEQWGQGDGGIAVRLVDQDMIDRHLPTLGSDYHFDIALRNAVDMAEAIRNEALQKRSKNI